MKNTKKLGWLLVYAIGCVVSYEIADLVFGNSIWKHIASGVLSLVTLIPLLFVLRISVILGIIFVFQFLIPFVFLITTLVYLIGGSWQDFYELALPSILSNLVVGVLSSLLLFILLKFCGLKGPGSHGTTLRD